MNKRALNAGLLYCLIAIIFKLVIILGGYSLTKFGFYYAQIISVFLIIPFFYLAIYQVREKDNAGIIGGKYAVRLALTVLAVGMVVMSVYNYVEFNWKHKELSIAYYNSQAYLDILKEQQSKMPDKIKVEDFPRIVKEQISSLSASRDVTAKLFPLLVIGLTGAFFVSVLMKKSAR